MKNYSDRSYTDKAHGHQRKSKYQYICKYCKNAAFSVLNKFFTDNGHFGLVSKSDIDRTPLNPLGGELCRSTCDGTFARYWVSKDNLSVTTLLFRTVYTFLSSLSILEATQNYPRWYSLHTCHASLSGA